MPLLEKGGLEAFLRQEVLPHAPDAWYDYGSVKIGYDIGFTRYFYKPQPMHSLDAIRADILALEKETEGMLGEDKLKKTSDHVYPTLLCHPASD